ncbi:CGNR zinc finger domain-containing protein [Streptomyces sp. NPDC014995]
MRLLDRSPTRIRHRCSMPACGNRTRARPRQARSGGSEPAPWSRRRT